MFKRISLALAFVTLFSWTLTGVSSAYSNSNWMGSLPANTPLSSLSIPGTHDSGALYEPINGTAKTQDLTIAQQLNVGVRFLDVRTRHYGDAFTIHHGAIYQNQNFDDVLNAVIGFLNNNPSETIIMSVKEEHTPANNTRTYEETFKSYVAKNPDKWLLTDRIPTLGEAKGKIVLLRRFDMSQSAYGINATAWQENTTFNIQNAASMKIQDYFKVSDKNKKWSDIQNMYNESKSQNSAWLYINYTSGYDPGWFGIPNIRSIKDYMNPKVNTFFTTNTKGRFGISVMDFIDESTAAKIIATNF
ncbi:phosphatidylinositol-specific phospholipase C [Paenibacillus sp. Z3-2]